MAKSRSVQSIVNAFPEWSNVRSDEQSIGFQLLNTTGKTLDYLYKQLNKVNSNFFLNTAAISDIDLYYKLQLPMEYEFTKEDDDNTEFFYLAPTVSGYVDDNRYAVTIAENNNIETFWYQAYPTRLSLSETNSFDHFIVSGYINDSPLLVSGITTHLTNRLTVKIEDGTSFIGITDNGDGRQGVVYIEGKDRNNQEITEELFFIYNNTFKTINEFSEVTTSGVKVYGIEDPDTTIITVTSASFNQEDYILGYSELDENVNGNNINMFWAIGSGTQAGQYTLDLKVYNTDDIGLRLDGFTSKQTILQQELLDTSSNRIIPLDLTIEPFSDRLWVVDSGNLYIYNDELPYPVLKDLLDKKQYHAECVIQPNTYYAVLGDEIELDYLWKRQTQGIVYHRVWVTYPDGNTYSLENGIAITYHTDSSSWIYGEPQSRKIRPSEFYTLDQYGDYVYSLEVKYTDQTKSLDKRVVSVVYKIPEIQFSLSDLGITTTARGIDFDSEYNLWILDIAGVKYKIDRHYDNMMVDFERKVLYFREPYTRVDVF